MKPYFDSGDMKIYHGDALELLPEVEPFDALITDPPYSSGGQYRSDRMRSTVEKYVNSSTQTVRPEFSGDNRDQRAFFAWCSLWLAFAIARAKPEAHLFVFTDWRQLPTMTDAIQSGGWVWRGLGTWHKPGIRMQRGGLSQSAEYVVWGTNGSWSRDNDHSPQNVIQCGPVLEKDHIAEKPEPVLRWLVPFAPVGGLVVDPFLGSGTTLRIAKATGRRGIGFDTDEASCELAAKLLSEPIAAGLL